MVTVKIDGSAYPVSVSGKVSDRDWDGRESKAITLEADYTTASALFHDGTAWSIVDTYTAQKFDSDGLPIMGEDGQPVFEERVEEYDNSEFLVLGDITVHTDGTCTVKMGKETNEEKLLILLYGGEK